MHEVQDINVEQVMERIRENIRRRRSAQGGAVPEDSAPPFHAGQAAVDLAYLHSGYDIQHIPLGSHRRTLGPLVFAIKKALRKLLTPILERQVAYNAANTRLVAHVKERLETLERQQTQALEKRIETLEQTQAQLGDKVIGSQARLREEVLGLEAQFRQEMLAAESRHRADLASHSQVLQTLKHHSQAMRERVSRAERKLRRILHAIAYGQSEEGQLEAKGGTERKAIPFPDLEPDFDYAGLEERFRGAEEDITECQRAYVEFFRGKEDILDIGCGRGEFLELLREAGIGARGVDLDFDMVLLCQDKGLDVVADDAFAYLGALPDGSVGGVFAAQLIEHLHPQRVIGLVKLCYRKLAPGGVLILETPNPKCLTVFAETFYKDPSHVQPIHPDTMQFLLEATGFHEVEIRFSAPVDASARIPLLQVPGADLERFNQGIELLNSLLFGFQDYAVIGRKGLVSARQSIIAGRDAPSV